MRRRDFLARSASLAAGLALGGRSTAWLGADDESWDAGSVRHLLPTASDRRLLIKMSLVEPAEGVPRLRVAGRIVSGGRSDSTGRFWRFDVSGLEPGTEYRLELLAAGGGALCAPWPLATLPSAGESPERCRLLVYTCAGGHPGARLPDGTPAFVALAERRRLLRRALAFQPDAVIAIGDHVYWDLRAGRSPGLVRTRELVSELGPETFLRSLPVLGSENEARLVRVVDPQLADLYGTLLRSTPAFFVQDDHDYFENDHADDEIVTFPPDPFMLRLARATQHLYYPEFLPDPTRPPGLPGASSADRPPGVSESFGTLRWGDLLEADIWDCRRFLSLKGASAGFLPAEAERWLSARMAANDTTYLVQVPSTPVGWGAGKWAEWYPDVLQGDGRLGTDRPKPYWQEGWAQQHDRLLRAASAMRRTPLFVSGDLHALAAGRVLRSGEWDLRANPVVSVLSGPLSTGPAGFPSAFRGTPAQPSVRLDVDQRLEPLERNGFTLVDVTPDGVEVRLFSWALGEEAAAIDRLEPFFELEV